MKSSSAEGVQEGNAIRVFGGRLQTSLDTYRNPKTGSLIDLTAVVHVGDPEYYQEINRIAAVREAGGMVLHSEKIMPIPEAAVASDLELAALHALHMKMRRVNQQQASRFGLAAQMDHLRVGEVHDVTFDQHIRNKGPALREHYESLAAKERYLTGQFDLNERIDHDRNLLYVAGLTRQDTLGCGRGYDAELIRETKQLNAIRDDLQEDPSSSFVLHWGAAHIPGFREHCQELGYELESQRWITSQSLILG